MPEPRDDETPTDASTTTPDATADTTASGAVDETTGELAAAHAPIAESPATETEAPAEPAVPDAELLAAVDLARAALLEITPAETVGEPAGSIVEGDRVLSLLLRTRSQATPAGSGPSRSPASTTPPPPCWRPS